MRIALFASLALSSLVAKEVPVILHANTIERNATQVQASGDVVLFYKDKYFQSNNVHYDTKLHRAQFLGESYILDGASLLLKSNAIDVDFRSESMVSRDIYLNDFANQLWVLSKSSQSDGKNLELKEAILSSCMLDNLDWHLSFEQGVMQDDWASFRNVRLYADTYQVLYLPYFAFPTTDKRTSGLLIPQMSFSNNEGFRYMQPIFFAPTHWFDIELNPQIRTGRGYGLFATTRFKDSKNSSGSLRLGDFIERSSYRDKYDLKNSSHYGLELLYNRHSIFAKENDARDGLFVDMTLLNDVDYLNVQFDNDIENLDNIITSRINYFYEEQNDYYGAYAKYFVDTTRISNKGTVQILPRVQYHRYTQNTLFDNITYNVDFKNHNYVREDGVIANQNEFSLPLEVYFDLYDDYLSLMLSENLYYTNIAYKNRWKGELEDGTFFSNYHKLSLYSDLIKKFPSFLHTLHLSGAFIIPSFEEQEGEFEKISYLNTETQAKQLQLALEEYFYSFGGKSLFEHRMKLPILYDAEDKYGDLLNEIIYNISEKLYLENDLKYSFKDGGLNSVTTAIKYDTNTYDIMLSHLYRRNDEVVDGANFISFDGNYEANKKYNLFSSLKYDFENSFLKDWKFGWNMNERCWNYNIYLGQEVVPILTSAGENSILNNYVSLQLNLVPIGGFSQTYRQRGY